MATATRKSRMESFLRREIASCITTELRDPRLGLITITRVEMSGDLQNVTAYWTALGDAKTRNLATHALEAARSYIQHAYAKSVRTRHIPQLSFHYDDREDKRRAMDDLIRRARATDPDPTPEPPTDAAEGDAPPA